ncbi:MAG: hypothetical protein WCW13_04645 [archaeon]
MVLNRKKDYRFPALKRGVISSSNSMRIPGLSIVLPANASAATKKMAIKMGQREVLTKKRQVAKATIAEQEKTLATFIQGREFVIPGRPYAQSKLVLNSADGKHVTITHITGRGKVEQVSDIGKFASFLELALKKARLI